MFSGFMVNAWEVASIVAVVAGVVGFFTVMRGSAFAAHAIPNGSFAGAAGASLIGVSTLLGLGVFSLGGAMTIGLLGRRGRHDVATALTLVAMLALGALFLSFSVEYAPEVYSLLFGEVLGISPNEIAPTAILGALCILAIAILYRPLMLSSVLPDVGEARGVSSLSDGDALPRRPRPRDHDDRAGRRDAADLQPHDRRTRSRPLVHRPAAPRDRPVGGDRAADRVGSLAASYETNYPVGFFVGTAAPQCTRSAARGLRGPRAGARARSRRPCAA